MTELCHSMIRQLDQMRLKDLDQFTSASSSSSTRISMTDRHSYCTGHDEVGLGECQVRKIICVLDHLIGQDGKFEVDMNQIIGTANKCKMKNLHISSVLSLPLSLVREAKTTYIIKFIQLLDSTKENSPATKMKYEELLEEESDDKIHENF